MKSSYLKVSVSDIPNIYIVQKWKKLFFTIQTKGAEFNNLIRRHLVDLLVYGLDRAYFKKKAKE